MPEMVVGVMLDAGLIGGVGHFISIWEGMIYYVYLLHVKYI